MKIEIFGTGCSNCEKLKNNAQRAVDELALTAEVVKVEDFEQIIRKKITKTPGLVIDGEIRSMGRVPKVEEIKEMLSVKNATSDTALGPSINVINPSCGCSSKGTVIFPCSGGSNVGQITNEAAKVLVAEGKGKFSCLAGVASHGEGFISSAKDAGLVLALDGCNAKCAYKALVHAGVEPDVSAVVMELGIKKDYTALDPPVAQIRQFIDSFVDKL